MILITSGAFLSTEFTALLGKLPPSFLPVGNRRLFEWQLADLTGLDEKIVLTVPEGFRLTAEDSDRLASAGVKVLPVPEGMSLGQSVVYAINVEEATGGQVRILHGDTLCGRLDNYGDDVVVAGQTSEYYSWAEFYYDDGGRLRLQEGFPSGTSPRQVLAGYFSIADGAALVRCISLAGFNFIAGLDLYAQERTLKVAFSKHWLDFGHVQTYFKSKARHTTERAFNQLNATPRWIEKHSSDLEKMEAEAAWFEALPRDVRANTPQYLGRVINDTGKGYSLEYLYLNTLSELAVFGRLPTYSWLKIFSLCGDFLATAQAQSKAAIIAETPLILSSDYADKTMSRLETFASNANFDLDEPTKLGDKNLPSVRRIADEIASQITDARTHNLGLSHGDFCFSNIFHDFRSGQIKVVDPRGRDFSGRITPFGDLRYDAAKFLHSVWGRYDFIIAGHFHLKRVGSSAFDLSIREQGTDWSELESAFFDQNFAGYNPKSDELRAMTIQLFLSMLPLHYDRPDRQYAFLANALRLYNEL